MLVSPPVVANHVAFLHGSREKGRWLELDLPALLEECRRYGMACDRIESMMMMRPGGAGDVVEAAMAAEARRG